MNDVAIHWHPPGPCDPATAREAIARYMDQEARFVVFQNGTALLLKPELDRPAVINGAMNEVRFKTDFNAMPMKDGNYLVWLASPVCVFLSALDAEEAVASLKADPSAAMLPGESFVASPKHPDHFLIGLAGRAKGYLDSRFQIQVARYAPSET